MQSDTESISHGQPVRFIADHMLGKLARWLRILGYDTVFSPDLNDADIARDALREERIVLTRDAGLIARKAVRSYIFIESQDCAGQLRQVFSALGLRPDPHRVFTLCPFCNREVAAIERRKAACLVPPYVYRTTESFSRCPACGRIFWRGTHFNRTMERIRNIFGKT